MTDPSPDAPSTAAAAPSRPDSSRPASPRSASRPRRGSAPARPREDTRSAGAAEEAHAGAGLPEADARLARIEAEVGRLAIGLGETAADVDAVRTALATLRVELRRVDDQLRGIPGKGLVVATVAAGVVVTVALITLFARLGWLSPGA